MEVLGACATVLQLLEQAVRLVNAVRGYRELPVLIQGLQREVSVTQVHIGGLYQAFQQRYDDQEYMVKMSSAVKQYLELLAKLVMDINYFLFKLSDQSRIHTAISYFLANLGSDINNFSTRLTSLTTLINTAFIGYEEVLGRQMQEKMSRDLSVIMQQFTVKSTVIGPSPFVAANPFFVNEISFNDMFFAQQPFHTNAAQTISLYEATFQGEDVVVKVVQKYSSDNEVQNNFMKEIRAATKLTGRHVVQVYAICRETNPDRIGIVMEKMDGDLRRLLQQKSFDWRAKIEIAIQVAQGLRSVHASGMMHGNLMARNVLHCNANTIFKIGDFAAAKKVIGQISSRNVLPPERSANALVFMAPELIAVAPKWSINADIFSFGVLLWEIATQQIPTFGIHLETVGIPDSLVTLIAQCCVVEPTARPDIQSVIFQLEQALQQFPQFVKIPTSDVPSPATATAAQT